MCQPFHRCCVSTGLIPGKPAGRRQGHNGQNRCFFVHQLALKQCRL
ncbi:Uncharacterized protein PPKH_0580 [Pseudomonas putida]|nr:Uncharacterized protein PPKH_0580 [Pseudomonas putida]